MADDLIELKIVTDFSHLIPAVLFQVRKSAGFFLLLNSFIDKVKDFSFLLQIHCENRRQFSQMEICHIIMEMSDFHPGHIDKKPWFLPRGWNFTNFSQEELHFLVEDRGNFSPYFRFVSFGF